MKIAAYRIDSGTRFGVVEGGRLRIRGDARSARDVIPVAALTGMAAIDLDPTRLAAPIEPVQRNVFCVGWNYLAHLEEGKGFRGSAAAQDIPERPAFFTKATRAVIVPFDSIDAHAAITETLDWEVELAVVIGRDGRDISEADAPGHVLGYTVANDVSARNVQRGHGGQWFRGKSLDATCPVGPWIVTPDELGDLASLGIRCRVNGEEVQSAVLGDMHFAVPALISELSRGLTLLAGDVILTGTPPGVGFARTPPRYLAAGDVVESEIDGIGTIRNEVRA
jgi:2,4-didehydro-3-deoxy-L-rhamnonate hydrolase